MIKQMTNAIDRRGVMRTLIGLTLGAASPSTVSAAFTIVDLKDLGEALTAAAKAVGDLSDSFARAGNHFIAGLDMHTARSTQQRMIQLSVRLGGLGTAKGMTLDTIEDYVTTWGRVTHNGQAPIAPTDTSKLSLQWSGLRSRMVSILGEIKGIAEGLRQETSTFVFNPLFTQLGQQLAERQQAWTKLLRVAPPLTPNEITALHIVAGRYRELQQRFGTLLGQINAYLAAHPQG